MKTLLDTNYKGHNIKVVNKWNYCALIVDGATIVSSTKILATEITLEGSAKIEGRDARLVLDMKTGYDYREWKTIFYFADVFLKVDKKLIAKSSPLKESLSTRLVYYLATLVSIAVGITIGIFLLEYIPKLIVT